MRLAIKGAALVLTVTMASLAFAGPAPAADDSFNAYTTDSCGVITFVDYGDSGDDYFTIRDMCPDGHGVKAWVWVNGFSLFNTYLGGGAYSAVSLFPRDFKGGETIDMQVCLVDGSNDTTPAKCGANARVLVDG